MTEKTSPSHFKEDQNQLEPQKLKFYLLWLIPLFSLIICIVVLWQSYDHHNYTITIQFNDAKGIIAGKTPIIYNGIIIGEVENISATKDLKKINVIALMDSKFKRWLTNKTEFWLVKANIGLTGITGLDTLVSGNYIEVKPSNKGVPTKIFQAHDTPPEDTDLPGLHLSLLTPQLNSINTGTPVYYKNVVVGKVVNYKLNSENNILLHLIIFPQYRHLIRKNTRFWKTSSIYMQANLTGIHLSIDSLSSIFSGGITFSTPKWEQKKRLANSSDIFSLYKNQEEAQLGVMVKIKFPLSNMKISAGMDVKFHQINIGKITRLDTDHSLSHLIAYALINPKYKKLLVEGAHFWTVPLSFKNISASSLIHGSYLALDVSKKAIKNNVPKTTFNGLSDEQYAYMHLSGVNFLLKTDTLNGLKIHSPLIYQGMTIGQIQFIKFNPSDRMFYLNINIPPAYQDMVNTSSIFKNNSPLNVSLSATGLDLKNTSLTTLITGEIIVKTPYKNAPKITSSHIFNVQNQFSAIPGKHIFLETQNLDSVAPGTPILYLGIKVGKVVRCDLSNHADKVMIDAIIFPKYTSLVTSESQFWKVAGIHIEGGLFKGIEFKTKSLNTMIIGGIAFATPRFNEHTQKIDHHFILHDKAKRQWKNWHPQLQLNKTAKKRVSTDQDQ